MFVAAVVVRGAGLGVACSCCPAAAPIGKAPAPTSKRTVHKLRTVQAYHGRLGLLQPYFRGSRVLARPAMDPM